jgi:hypothetical protein
MRFWVPLAKMSPDQETRITVSQDTSGHKRPPVYSESGKNLACQINQTAILGET